MEAGGCYLSALPRPCSSLLVPPRSLCTFLDPPYFVAATWATALYCPALAATGAYGCGSPRIVTNGQRILNWLTYHDTAERQQTEE